MDPINENVVDTPPEVVSEGEVIAPEVPVEEVVPADETVVVDTPAVVEETPAEVIEDTDPMHTVAKVMINNDPDQVVEKRVRMVVINDSLVPDPNEVNPGVFSS